MGVRLGPNITKTQTAAQGPEFPLGTVWQDPKTGYEFTYINADTAITDGQFLTPTLADADAPWALIPAATAGIDIAGVANVSIPDEGFGWIMTRGKKLLAAVADAVVAGDMLGTTTTAGRVDAITFTTTAATLAQLTAGFKSQRSRRVLALTDGTASNTATVWIM